MRIHYFQHVPFEDPAEILNWARDAGHSVASTRFYDGQPAPTAADDYDMLVVMGGPMNIYEEKACPWLPSEKAAICHAIDGGKPVLGICLGAQLIADVLGGPVTAGKHKEIGWFPVRLTVEGRASTLFAHAPSEFMAFHWHGDTFAIPPGATRLAETEACPNQGFVYDEYVVGLQFHIESTEESIERLITHSGDELVDAPYIQSPLAISAGSAHIPAAHAVLYPMLDALAKQA